MTLTSSPGHESDVPDSILEVQDQLALLDLQQEAQDYSNLQQMQQKIATQIEQDPPNASVRKSLDTVMSSLISTSNIDYSLQKFSTVKEIMEQIQDWIWHRAYLQLMSLINLSPDTKYDSLTWAEKIRLLAAYNASEDFSPLKPRTWDNKIREIGWSDEKTNHIKMNELYKNELESIWKHLTETLKWKAILKLWNKNELLSKLWVKNSEDQDNLIAYLDKMSQNSWVEVKEGGLYWYLAVLAIWLIIWWIAWWKARGMTIPDYQTEEKSYELKTFPPVLIAELSTARQRFINTQDLSQSGFKTDDKLTLKNAFKKGANILMTEEATLTMDSEVEVAFDLENYSQTYTQDSKKLNLRIWNPVYKITSQKVTVNERENARISTEILDQTEQKTRELLEDKTIKAAWSDIRLNKWAQLKFAATMYALNQDYVDIEIIELEVWESDNKEIVTFTVEEMERFLDDFESFSSVE